MLPIEYRNATADENEKDFTVYEIELDALEYLAEKLTKLAKRANKLGMTANLDIISFGEFSVDCKTKDGIKYQRHLIKLAFVGTTVKFNGWEFIATISPLESGNLVNCVPGKTYPVSLRDVTTNRCDHCNVNRQRNEVFIIFNEEENIYKVVGRTCIQDFLGHSPEKFLALASWVDSLGELFTEASDSESFGGANRAPMWPIESFLKTASVIIRRLGFTSKTKAYDAGTCSTYDEIMFLLNPRNQAYAEKFARLHSLYPEQIDSDKTEKSLEWVRGLTDTSNDYIYNLKTASELDYVTHKTAGLLASLIPAYGRATEKEKENSLAKQSSNHMGEVGKRYGILNLDVQSVKYFDNEWGTKTLVNMVDKAGNRYTMWISGQAVDALEQANENSAIVNITATVKEHKSWQGVKQTQLSRPVMGVKGKHLKNLLS